MVDGGSSLRTDLKADSDSRLYAILGVGDGCSSDAVVTFDYSGIARRATGSNTGNPEIAMAQATLARTEDYSKSPNGLMLTFRPAPQLWVV